MNISNIVLVQKTLAQVQLQAEAFTGLFYGRLFDQHPELRPLFTTDLGQQGARSVAALQLAVTGLNQPQTIMAAIKQLGQRHVGYGVQDAHYHLMGEALLWSLAQTLGDAFTPAVEAAWAEAYSLLTGLMKEAACQLCDNKPDAFRMADGQPLDGRSL